MHCRGLLELDQAGIQMICDRKMSHRRVRVVFRTEFAQRAGWPEWWSRRMFLAREISHHAGGDTVFSLEVPSLGQRLVQLDARGYFVQGGEQRTNVMRANAFLELTTMRPLLVPLLVDAQGYPICPWCGALTVYARGGVDWCNAHELAMPDPQIIPRQFSLLLDL